MKNKILIFVSILVSFLFIDNVNASEEYVTGVLDEGSDAYNFIADTSNLPSTIHEHIFITNEGGDSYSESDNYVVLLTFSDKYRPYVKVVDGNGFFSLFDNEKNYYSAKMSANYDDIDVYYLSYDLENNTYSWILQDNVQLIFYYRKANYLKRYFNSTEYYKDDFTTIANEANIELNSNYKYDDLIHDYNIAQTYFNLDLEQLQKNDYNIDISYAYGNQTSIDIVDAYLKITYADNTNSYFSMNTNDNPIVNVFMGSYQSCLDNSKGIISVQVVFPMESTQDVDYKIQLESNINFDISYLYDEEYITSLTTIDLTGKYALVLIPKVNLQNELFQDFYLSGTLEIRGISDIDNITIATVQATKYYNNVFRYITDYRYTVSAIQFVNNDYEKYPNLEKSVTFDSTYFEYYVVDTKNGTITITNPNTNKTQNLNMYDINYQYQLTESDKNSNSVFGMFKSVNNYISTLKDTFNIFIEQFNFLFSNLNSQIQLAIKTLFIIIVIISIVMMIRK